MRIHCFYLVVAGLGLFGADAFAQNGQSPPAWFDPQVQAASLQSVEPGFEPDFRDFRNSSPSLAACCSETGDFGLILQRLDALEGRDEVFTSRCGWYVSGGVRYAQPRGLQLPVHVTGAPTQGVYDFDFDASVSPFGKLEWVREDGLGLRGSYWYARNSGRAIPETVANGPFALTMTTHVADLELTQDIDFNFAQLIFTGGARYLNTKRESDQPATFNVRIPEITGYGPTVSGEFRRRIDCLTLYSSLRASLLYGDQIHVLTLPAGGFERHSQAGYLPVGDLEVGVESPKFLGLPINVDVSCFGKAFRDVAYLGLQVQAGVNW